MQRDLPRKLIAQLSDTRARKREQAILGSRPVGWGQRCQRRFENENGFIREPGPAGALGGQRSSRGLNPVPGNTVRLIHLFPCSQAITIARRTVLLACKARRRMLVCVVHSGRRNRFDKDTLTNESRSSPSFASKFKRGNSGRCNLKCHPTAPRPAGPRRST
jgi:hypothetical protein